MDDAIGPAAARWAELLAGWAIPEDILRQAPTSPWAHDPAQFAADDSLPRDSRSSIVAREVLPHHGGTVLDVGCGGGRASLSLVPPAELIIGVDSNPAMLSSFTAAALRADVMSTTFEGRWPDVCTPEPFPVVDVAVCHHVVYNVADLEPFLTALTDHARLAVVIELTDRHPQSAWNAAWRQFWGIERPVGPTADDFVAAVRELDWEPEVWRGPKPPMASGGGDPARAVSSARRRLCLPADRDDEIAAWLDAHPPDWTDTAVTLRWPGSG
ncbi:MAG: class I SAM-dependent methyltransferase [Acidimicrobiia bacterium]